MRGEAVDRVEARRRWAVAVLLLAVAGEIATCAHYVQHSGQVPATRLLEVSTPLWALAVAALAVARPGRRLTAWLVLGGAVALYVAAMTHAPTTSDDDFRYAWDARVQLHGIDPYRYPPSAPQLAPLRQAWEFGTPDHCQHPFPGGCTSINRPTVRTIYPPVAQLAFDAIHLASFGGRGNHLPLQIAGALGSLAVAVLLLRHGSERGRPWAAALWAWCPIVSLEYANNAHIDWLAALLVVVALGTSLARRTPWAAALVGAAVAVKIYPGLVLPSLMRRRPVATVAAAVGVVALSYVPHVLAVGSAVIGYLPGYLRQEDYDSGGRLLLLSRVLPSAAATVVGLLIVLAAAVYVWRRGDPEHPAAGAVLVTGVAFLTFTPSFGWYTGLLIALVALSGALEWLPVCFAAELVYLNHPTHHWSVVFLVAALLTVLGAAWRLRAASPRPSVR